MKNLFKLTVLTLFIGLGMMLQSCDSNETGLAKVKLEMKATTDLSTINASGRTMNTGLVFTDILIGATEIEFETLEENENEDNSLNGNDDDNEIEDMDEDGEDDNEEIEFKGSFVIDLIAGTSTPDFGIADIAPGIYEEIEIELKPILEGDISMFVAFEFTPAGGTEVVRVEYSNSDEMEFEIEKEGGFLLDAGALNKMLVMIDLDVMFAGVDLSTASADVDGVVRINSTSNTDLAALIANGLDDIMEGGEDEDEDGELDDD